MGSLPLVEHRSHDGTRQEGGSEEPALIAVEANLLRLPLFALHTKGLKSLDGIECRGRVTRDEQVHAFTFRATRSSGLLYPGPLARSIHLAFLSFITDAGLPFRNPLTWSWRELCRRMRVSYGGQMVQHLKGAIRSTAALFLWSEYALYDKTQTAPLHTQHDGLHLYDRVMFAGSTLPDGTVAERNELWLSSWYLENLNALFTAPLDYDLWRFLDAQSSVSSRLYELLLLNFDTAIPVLRMNYGTLVQFLPLRPAAYLSLAKRQLEPAFQLLAESRIVHAVEWTDAKSDLAQLGLSPRRPSSPGGRTRAHGPWISWAGFPGRHGSQRTATATISGMGTGVGFLPALVRRECPQAHREGTCPGPRTLDGAWAGQSKARIPVLVKRMKVEWPDAKTFGAIAAYLPDAISALAKQSHHIEQQKREQKADEDEQQTRTTTAQEQAAWKNTWQTLPEDQRERIRQTVLDGQPKILVKFPAIVERLCLKELANQQQSGQIHPAG